MIYKKNNLYCNKCKSYIDIENIEDYEVDWFEYGSYSQKKLKCKECGNWITITTKEDINTNYDLRYYEYNEIKPKYKIINNWDNYMRRYYSNDYYYKDYDNDYYEDYEYYQSYKYLNEYFQMYYYDY